MFCYDTKLSCSQCNSLDHLCLSKIVLFAETKYILLYLQTNNINSVISDFNYENIKSKHIINENGDILSLKILGIIVFKNNNHFTFIKLNNNKQWIEIDSLKTDEFGNIINLNSFIGNIYYILLEKS